MFLMEMASYPRVAAVRTIIVILQQVIKFRLTNALMVPLERCMNIIYILIQRNRHQFALSIILCFVLTPPVEELINFTECTNSGSFQMCIVKTKDETEEKCFGDSCQDVEWTNVTK